MATTAKTVSNDTKNYCAILIMKDMLLDYAQINNLSFEDALTQFAVSSTYEALFDFSTGIWRESSGYLMELYEEELQRVSHASK